MCIPRPQVMNVSIKEVRDRIGSVSNTKKITEAMKLVAAAKVRRAQEAVVNGRPFAENLVKVGACCLYCFVCVMRVLKNSKGGAGVPSSQGSFNF
jgi:hypothetical protein